MTQTMHFGVTLPQIKRSWAEARDAATTFDELGFDSVWVCDHFYGVPMPNLPIFEAWSELAAVGALTRRVELGTLVTPVFFRNPAVLAKQVATIDHVSNGRTVVGLGGGWFAMEFESYGLPFPAVGERLRALDETATALRRLWTEPSVTLEGAHVTLRDAMCEPKPVRRPPILIGGGGEQRTLRIAAKYADMTHWFALGLETLLHKKEVLERHCEEIGRDPGTIELTMGAPVVVTSSDAEAKAFLEAIPEERRPYVAVGSPEQVVDRLRPYIEAGFTGFTFNNAIYRTPEQIALVGDLLKLVATEVPVGAH